MGWFQGVLNAVPVQPDTIAGCVAGHCSVDIDEWAWSEFVVVCMLRTGFTRAAESAQPARIPLVQIAVIVGCV
jgi:hypothetical protein